MSQSGVTTYYLRHESCNRCGSSDARAIYSDGSSFCFSCRKPSRGVFNPTMVLASPVHKERDLALPSDVSFEYPEHVLNWIFQYGITIEELITNEIYYSRSKDQLIYTWKDDSGEIFLWQARNFSPKAKSKCFTKGLPEYCVPLYRGETVGPLVLVEDPVSALKIGRYSPCSPLLGSSVSLNKIKRLAGLPEAFLGVFVWLDGNMYDKAQQIAHRFQLLGVDAQALYTEKDPKECDEETILHLLQLQVLTET